MARSNRIYLVYPNIETDMPKAAFTVKHEAIRYIKRELETLEKLHADMSKYSYTLYGGADGRAEEWIEIDWKE